MNSLFKLCDLKGKRFKTVVPHEDWSATKKLVLAKIDTEFQEPDYKFTAENIRKSTDFEEFKKKNLILDDNYIKIFVNPFHNNLPPALLNETKYKKITLPCFGENDNLHYQNFNQLYGKPNSDQVKDRPETFNKNQSGLKPKLKSLSNKQRGFVECVTCNKKRVIYGEKKLNKEQQILLKDCLDSIDFTCGDELLPDDDVYKSLKDNIVCVDRRKNCSYPLDAHYYKKFDPVCCVCLEDLTGGDFEKYETRKKKFFTVIPICSKTECETKIEDIRLVNIKGGYAKDQDE